MEELSQKKVGLFFGSDTGNTEEITQMIKELWNFTKLEVIEACDMTTADYDRFEYIILGLSTWYDGDLQSDFEEFYEQFKTIDFTGKTVAMYGLGDQYGYAEYFVDGLGILGKEIVNNGGKIVGLWPSEGYEFDESKGLYNDQLFYGLALDFENQMELNESRVKTWIEQVHQEFKDQIRQSVVVS